MPLSLRDTDIKLYLYATVSIHVNHKRDLSPDLSATTDGFVQKFTKDAMLIVETWRNVVSAHSSKNNEHKEKN